MTNVNDDYEAMLAELARQGVARVSPMVLKQVAEGLWYEKKVPDLNRVPARYRRDAGYVVDRLLRFNVLSKEQKLVVLRALEPFKPKDAKSSRACRDPLAQAWGAQADLTSRFPELMPLQTRQYALDKASASPRLTVPYRYSSNSSAGFMTRSTNPERRAGVVLSLPSIQK